MNNVAILPAVTSSNLAHAYYIFAGIEISCARESNETFLKASLRLTEIPLPPHDTHSNSQEH